MITQIGFDPWVYDKDGDCYISAAERDQATADWQSGIITMSNALAVVNLYNYGTKNPACGEPPPPPPKANLHGLVHDKDGNPLEAVSVVLIGLSTTTGLDGTFDFTGVPFGPYTIACEKTGYTSFSEDIVLSEGDNEIDITMEAKEEVGIWEWIKGHWKWIAGGAGATAAISIGIALAKKRKR